MALLLGVSCLTVGLVACDESAVGSTPEGSAPKAAPPSGTSAIDNRPIVHLQSKDLQGDEYAASVRDALVGIDLAALAAPPSAAARGTSLSSDGVLLKDVFASRAARGGSGADVPSTDMVLLDGSDYQEYVLTARVAGRGTANRGASTPTYAVLDPEVFCPDLTDGQATSRTIPVTNLSTGAQMTVVMTAESATVDGNANVTFVVVEALPVINELPQNLTPPPCEENCGGGGPGGGGNPGGGTGGGDPNLLPYLGVHSVRVDQNFDSGFTINDKQEVQFTSERTDDYSRYFPRENTRKFDSALWTVPRSIVPNGVLRTYDDDPASPADSHSGRSVQPARTRHLVLPRRCQLCRHDVQHGERVPLFLSVRSWAGLHSPDCSGNGLPGGVVDVRERQLQVVHERGRLER